MRDHVSVQIAERELMALQLRRELTLRQLLLQWLRLGRVLQHDVREELVPRDLRNRPCGERCGEEVRGVLVQGVLARVGGPGRS